MASINKKLSGVKALILKILSKGDWISSTSLLKATKQKYFDRRIRELRDELGYDIETGTKNGKPHYRLRSKRRLPQKLRTYLGATQKKELIKSLPPHCSLCGKTFDSKRKSVFDHRIPLLRGGIGTKENFQLVCQECNNQKRTQCKGCDLECKVCFFAFPEKYPRAILIQLSNEEVEQLSKKAALASLSLTEFCLQIIKNIK